MRAYEMTGFGYEPDTDSEVERLHNKRLKWVLCPGPVALHDATQGLTHSTVDLANRHGEGFVEELAEMDEANARGHGVDFFLPKDTAALRAWLEECSEDRPEQGVHQP